VEKMWNQFDVESLVVDVLVLCAARIQPPGSMMEIRYKEVWADFTANVGSHMLFTDLFYHQKKRTSNKRLVRICICGGLYQSMTNKVHPSTVHCERVFLRHSRFQNRSSIPKRFSIKECWDNGAPADRWRCIGR
jgi:hypothetical protein